METFYILRFLIIYLTLEVNAPHLKDQLDIEANLTKKNPKWKRFDEYDEIAKASGGIILNVEKTDYPSTEFLANTTVKQLTNYIFYIEKTKSPSFEFYVEKEIQEMNVVVNSFVNVDDIKVIVPPGSSTDMNVTAKTRSLFVASILNPTSGLWKAEVKLNNANKVYKAFVICRTNTYVTPIIYGEGFAVLEATDLLEPGTEYHVQASFIPDVVGANTTIRCLDAKRNSLCGSNVHTFNYLSRIVCPDENFFIEIEGVMADGTKFQRWTKVMTHVVGGNKSDATGTEEVVMTTSQKMSTVVMNISEKVKTLTESHRPVTVITKRSKTSKKPARKYTKLKDVETSSGHFDNTISRGNIIFKIIAFGWLVGYLLSLKSS